MQSDWLTYNEYTTCGCDLLTVGHKVVLEHVPSLSLSPYFFHQWVIPKLIFFYVLVIASCSVWTNFQGNKSGHWIINHSVMHAVQRKDEEVEDTDISCYCTKEYFWCLLHLDHVVASIQDSTNWLSYMDLALCFAKNATCIQVVITL